jgi:hypothetical protein
MIQSKGREMVLPLVIDIRLDFRDTDMWRPVKLCTAEEFQVQGERNRVDEEG